MYRKKCAGEHRINRCFLVLLLAGGVLSFVYPDSLAFSQTAKAADSPGPALVAASHAAPGSLEVLIVGISVNGAPKGDHFIGKNREGKIFFKSDDVSSLGFTLQTDQLIQFQNELYVDARSLWDTAFSFNESTLTLDLTSPSLAGTAQARSTLDLSPSPQRNYVVPHENSLFLNYGLTYNYNDQPGFRSVVLNNRLGARSGDLFFLSDSVYTSTADEDNLVRLMSTATYERPGDLQWISVGDLFTSSGDLGSTINIGGVSLTKVYHMDPYFLKRPMYDFSASVSAPSQVDVYVDGVLVRSEKVRPGDFDIKNLSYYGGARTIDVYIRDAYGNIEKVAYDQYFSDAMLRQGLHEYSYNAGFLREQFGTASMDYGKPAFSGFHRYGLNAAVNIGIRAEAGGGLYNAGLETVFVAPRLGLIRIEAAESDLSARRGAAASFQHTYQKGYFLTNLSFAHYSRDYLTLATRDAGQPVLQTTGFLASYGSIGSGTVSLGYTRTDHYNGSDAILYSLSYSRNLSRSLILNTSVSVIPSPRDDYRLFAGIIYSFGASRNISRFSGGAQWSEQGNSQSVQIEKDIPALGEGGGYHISASRTETDAVEKYRLSPYAQYNARYGTYSFSAVSESADGGRNRSYSASASGSIVYAGGFSGFARPVDSSFGIVMMDGLPDVGIRMNNEYVGSTDSAGKLVVPLRAYSTNEVAVDAKNIPLDVTLSSDHVRIMPSLWSGACIFYDVAKVRGVTGYLVLRSGDTAIPLEFYEITMNVNGREITAPTGKNGEFYIENHLLDPGAGASAGTSSCLSVENRRRSAVKFIEPGTYDANISYEGQKCMFRITFPNTNDIVADLGVIVCELPKRNPVIRIVGQDTRQQ